MQLNFGLVDNYYCDNYRNKNFSTLPPPLSILCNPHDYCKYTLKI